MPPGKSQGLRAKSHFLQPSYILRHAMLNGAERLLVSGALQFGVSGLCEVLVPFAQVCGHRDVVNGRFKFPGGEDGLGQVGKRACLAGTDVVEPVR